MNDFLFQLNKPSILFHFIPNVTINWNKQSFKSISQMDE